MGSVYKSAERTLIWLGEDDSTVHMAMELIVDQPDRPELNAEFAGSVAHEISDHFRDMNNPGNLVSQSADLPPLESGSWNALARFLPRP